MVNRSPVSKPLSFTPKPVAFSRAVMSETRVDVEAVSWITPVYFPGNPIIFPSQPITLSSSSVAAGEVSQLMHWAPRVAVSISASTEGGEELAGK